MIIDRHSSTYEFSDKSLAENDRPEEIELTFTSESNSYGIVLSNWVEGEEYAVTIPIDKNNPKEAIINLKPVEYEMYQPTSKCNSVNSFYQCLGNQLLKKEHYYKNCNHFCIPIIYQSLVDLVVSQQNDDNNDTNYYPQEICNSAKENFCIAIKMWQNIFPESTQSCHKACQISQYTGKVKFVPMIDSQLIGVDWTYSFSSNDMTVNEEYLIYDFVGALGSIGGSLGLFMGFSCLDLGFHLIELLFRKY